MGNNDIRLHIVCAYKENNFSEDFQKEKSLRNGQTLMCLISFKAQETIGEAALGKLVLAMEVPSGNMA